MAVTSPDSTCVKNYNKNMILLQERSRRWILGTVWVAMPLCALLESRNKGSSSTSTACGPVPSVLWKRSYLFLGFLLGHLLRSNPWHLLDDWNHLNMSPLPTTIIENSPRTFNSMIRRHTKPILCVPCSQWQPEKVPQKPQIDEQ
jgi:hypothetical protein